MDLISVIVPVYKVEEYLDKCITSIVEQTYRDLEIILVDDGSPDNCPQMCEAWAKKDNRIRVIHKENGGLSDARNAGIRVATGDFLAFVDSDDWISADFFEILMGAALENDAQIVASGVVKIDTKNQSFCGNKYEQKVYTSEEAIRTIMHGEGFHAVAWNKIYKKELFEGIIYPVNKLHEDEFVTYRLLDRAERLVICQEATYYYWQRSGSIMSTWSEKHLDALEAGLERLNLLKAKYPNLYPHDYATFCIACVSYYRELLKIKASKELLNLVKNYRKQIHISLKQWATLTLNQKVYVSASGVHIGLFSRILNWRG